VTASKPRERVEVILVDSPMGLRPLYAPAGWTYDKTARHLWSRLHHVADLRSEPQKTKRAEAVLDGQIEVLSIVIANSIGMAAWHWMMEAKRIAALGPVTKEDEAEARRLASVDDPER
jgi:hypothetical protein